MQKFYFEAVTKSGENITGYLFAENELKAREKLNQNELAVVLLRAYQEELLLAGHHKFEFEALSPEGKRFQGEIEAQDEYEAYKKLKKDHLFEVFYLADKAASLDEKQLKKQLGVPVEILERLNEELQSTKKGDMKAVVPQKTQSYEKESTDKLTLILKEKEEQMKFLQEKIDETLLKVNALMRQYEPFLLPEKRRFIQSELDRLARLRQSNSVEHLKSIILDLFEMLGSDEIFVDLQGDLLQELDTVKKEFQTLSMGFRHTINKGLVKITIDVDALKQGVGAFMNHKKFWYTLLRIGEFVSLGMFSASLFFLMFNGIRFLLGMYPLLSIFYFQSSLLWLLLVVSGMFWGFFRFQHASIFVLDFKKNVLLTTFFIGGVVFLLLQFPVFFFWTRF